jgi:uncharacterized membrane protein YfcA
MSWWRTQQVIVALVVVTGVAALVGWALDGTAGLRTAVWLPIALVAVLLPVLRITYRLRAALERRRPVKPEDRERRRKEREHGRVRRSEAFRRYRSVVRGAPRAPD